MAPGGPNGTGLSQWHLGVHPNVILVSQWDMGGLVAHGGPNEV